MIFGYKSLGQKFFLVLVLFSAGIFPACQSVKPAFEETDDIVIENAESLEIPPPNINLARPLEISEKPEDVALANNIDEIIEKSDYSNARWGVFVVSLKDGRVVVARDARKLFNPASIQKTLTAIVALDKLGADYRWKTSINAANAIENGVLNGDLTLYGRGAPDFGGDELNDLVKQLKAKGLTQITGNIVGDESYFKGEDIGDGWTWNDLQWHYGTEAGALTFNENKAGVYMKDGVPVSSTDYLQIQNDLQPKKDGETKAFGIRRGLADNQIYIWGNDEKAYGKVAVHNTALWAAKTLKESLEQQGITVGGEAKSVDWKTPDRLNVENSVELAFVESQPLSEIVKKMDKRSINVYAELLLRLLGKNFGDTAPGDNRQLAEVRGDDLAGTEVIKKFLAENKVAADELQIHDGSGLSRLDFVSPEAFVRAFIYAAQSKFSDIFTNSLPIAATDGTLGGRLGNVKGKIYAKTGTITFVNSLAGYAQAKDDEIYAFAIISNNITRKSDATRTIDAIATSLVKKDKDESDNKPIKAGNEKKANNQN
ncbi:MAG: D-alanyl-D-alanine carboxypeptidase/D-alanyl-D-alanine-endopeptidase [Acidobacteriota bacterium]